MEEKIDKPQVICNSSHKLSSEDILFLKSLFYSESDIDEIKRNINNVRYSISFFDFTTPENGFKKYITAKEAEETLKRKNFLSAVAEAITDLNHYSVSQINGVNGEQYLTVFI